MDEGGGGCATRQNLMYKSLDGGVTWTNVTLGARFSPICDAICSSNSYFAQVNPIIRHMGWGEPGVGPNGVVHYVFAGLGTNGDPGDIYYTRSADNGVTWSTAIKINFGADAPFKEQWMPSLSADAAGGAIRTDAGSRGRSRAGAWFSDAATDTVASPVRTAPRA